MKGKDSAIQKYSARYWAKEIATSESLCKKKFWKMAEESIKVYKGEHKIDDIERSLSVWWYCVNTVLPAYFSSTPKVEVNLKKRAGSTLYEVAATAIERNTQWCLDECMDFDQLGYETALQLLLTGRTVLWARYGAQIEEREEEFNLVLDKNTGDLVDANGKKYTGDTTKLEDRNGVYVGIAQGLEKESEEAVLDLVGYNDYLESDARNEREVTWKGRRAFISEEYATEMFGKNVANKLQYDSFPEALKKDRQETVSTHNGKAEIWEIHSEEAGKVFYIQPRGEKSILEVGDPPIKYKDFYPCEVMNASVVPESTLPVSDYTNAKDQILEVERLTTRIHANIQAVRTNYAYDATLEELEDLMAGDLKGIPIKNWPSYKKERGGLEGMLEQFPNDPYIKALAVLVQNREQALQQLYETLKISDLLRGASEPTKTATANRLESQWSSLGLIVRQNMFAKFMGRAIGKLGVVVSTQFSPEHLLDVGCVYELIEPLAQGNPDVGAELALQVVQIMRSDVERCYHLQIASDSMVALDERQDRQDGVDLMTSAGSFFQQMQGMIEQYPMLAPLSITLFKNVIRRYRGGKELEGDFIVALEQVGQLAQTKAEQAAQQPPDPKAQEVAARVQIAQMEGQTKIQSLQIEAADTHQKNMVALREMQGRMAIEFAKNAREERAAAADAVNKQRELEIKALHEQINLISVNAETANNRQLAMMEAARVKLEAIEKVLEGQRIANDHLHTQLAMVKDQAKHSEPTKKSE